MKMNELRAMSAVELTQKVTQTQRELDTLRLKAKQATLEQPHRIGQLRRDIARIQTLLREPQTPADSKTQKSQTQKASA